VETQPPEVPTPDVPPSAEDVSLASEELSESEKRARRLMIIISVVAGLLMVGVIVLLVFLSIDAYQATFDPAARPSPSSVVVAVLRDAAIVFVAFQTLIIGVLLIILMAQIQSLLVLLRDEVGPMLEAINETLATVRGTTQFVSHNVVSPVIRWSGYLAGLRRVAREIGGLGHPDSD
jgi:hypothetical protein